MLGKLLMQFYLVNQLLHPAFRGLRWIPSQ
jgi:hypothetical protein